MGTIVKKLTRLPRLQGSTQCLFAMNDTAKETVSHTTCWLHRHQSYSCQNDRPSRALWQDMDAGKEPTLST